MTKEILIYAQTDRNDKLLNVVLELANKAGELSRKIEDCIVSAILFTDGTNSDENKKVLSKNGFDKVYVAESADLKQYSLEYYSKIATELVKKITPEIFLIGATTQGRELAPVMATILNTGLTADCTELDINEKGQLAATRPTFGGNLMATILCKNYPQMATVRPKVFKKNDTEVIKNTEFEYLKFDLSSIKKRINLIEFIPDKQVTGVRIDEAEIVVAGGRGMQNPQGFKLLEELAELLGGAVGASRGAVEMKLANSSVQIGQTGKTVVPKIYIACGISGAVQHTVGMSGSDKIIAINKDENAPIFKIADTGIVGDVFEILPNLINELKKEKK